MKVKSGRGAFGTRAALIGVVGSFAFASPSFMTLPPLAGTTYYVNAELGNDVCYTGTLPYPEDLCPGPINGPFRTITRGLAAITAVPPPPAPFTIMVAGRFRDFPPLGPYEYDAALGEVFPLEVPPDTLLRYDAANSDVAPPTTTKVPAIIRSPLGPAPYVVRFSASGGVQYTAASGMDGSGAQPGLPYGFEIRGGDRALVLGATGPGSRMDVRIERVQVVGDGQFPVHGFAVTEGTAGFVIQNCRISADGIAGQYDGLVHLYAGRDGVSAGCTAGAKGIMAPTIRDTILTVENLPGTTTPTTRYFGIWAEACLGASLDLTVMGIDLDGRAGALGGIPYGIAQGVYVLTRGLTPAPVRIESSRIRNCGTYGIQLELGLSVLPGVADVSIRSNAIENTGVAPDLPGLTGFFVGSGLKLNIHTGSSLRGTVSANTFTGNRIGLNVDQQSLAPFPGVLTVDRNSFVGQVFDSFYPVGNPTGYGIVVTITSGAVLDSQLRFDSNILTLNQRDAVWVEPNLVYPGSGGGDITCWFRNNRVHANGSPPPAPLTDGYRIVRPTGATGAIAPLLIHETIVGQKGYGVRFINNGAGTPAAWPEIWNSIIWNNNLAPIGTGDDLFGFFFQAGLGGRVWNSDFCGMPFGLGSCGTVSQPTSANGFCISSDPVFVDEIGGNFELSCGICPPCSPPCGNCPLSNCVDIQSGVNPPPGSAPPLDALGRSRSVRIETSALLPDMGALELQTSCP